MEADCLKGSTLGCCVSQAGKFCFYFEGRVVDDVLWEGLPMDQPLWGLVIMRGIWKVEVVVSILNGEAACAWAGGLN